MDSGVITSFVVTVAIFTLTPGPSVLLVTANSLAHGPSKTIGTILGDLTANSLQILLASIGIASVVQSWPEGFQVLKWFGVSYLMFIGVKKLVQRNFSKSESTRNNQKGFAQLYFQGFLMSAVNPKAIIFFAALFPLFLNSTAPLAPQVSILGITFLSIDGVSLFIYAMLAFQLGSGLSNHSRRLQGKIVGIILIICALLLSLKRI